MSALLLFWGGYRHQKLDQSCAVIAQLLADSTGAD